MAIVERIHLGFQWAEPLNGKELNVNQVGSGLEITGLVPNYRKSHSPCDLMHQYEDFSKQLAKGRQRDGIESPEMCFANADTDEKLIAFVRKFGPVVAKFVQDTRFIPSPEMGEPGFKFHLIAHQDMEELRNEQAIFRAALALIRQLGTKNYNFDSAQQFIKVIAANIKDWPHQWEREKSLRKKEPNWMLRKDSFQRIEELTSARRDPILPAEVDGRIVICELLNSFPSTVFPNTLEMHSSIQFGIRPLVYAILRGQFLHPRGFAICLNAECSNFFNIERAGQQFCTPECSLRHRQREYWQKRGKQLRKKRAARRKR